MKVKSIAGQQLSLFGLKVPTDINQPEVVFELFEITSPAKQLLKQRKEQRNA